MEWICLKHRGQKKYFFGSELQESETQEAVVV